MKDIIEIKSSRDPSGSPLVGHSAGINFEKTAKKIVLHYAPRRSAHEFLLTADLYDLETPRYLLVYCPICRNTLRISEDNKRFEWIPDGRPVFRGYREEEVLATLGIVSLGGLLSVEEFGCTWELEPDLRRSFGLATCPWRVAIDKNIVRDA